MKREKGTSVASYKLLGRFDAVRGLLVAEMDTETLKKPLAYWALPNDRRLPLAFLGRPVRELIAAPFEELASTPGVGEKKIAALIRLLDRVAETDASSAELRRSDGNGADDHSSSGNGQSDVDDFKPALVSQAHWEKWGQTVRQHALGQEKLGSLAPTLRSLPTVIWNTPLSYYLQRSLDDIRGLKTHGEKRLSGVFEVFHSIHQTLSGSRGDGHLSIRLSPKFVQPVAAWIAEVVDEVDDGQQSVTIDEVRQRLVEPLLRQIEIDLGQTVYHLALGRLGIDGQPQIVRHQSRQMGVTRARVYQLLEDCHKMIHVRWPQGKDLLATLLDHLNKSTAPPDAVDLVRATAELFYPDKDASEKEDAAVEVTAVSGSC